MNRIKHRVAPRVVHCARKFKHEAGAMSVEWVGIVALLLIITGLTIQAVSDDGILNANIGSQISNVISDWISQFEPSSRTD